MLMLEKSIILSTRKINGQTFVTEVMTAEDLFNRQWPVSSYEILLVEEDDRSSWAIIRYRAYPASYLDIQEKP